MRSLSRREIQKGTKYDLRELDGEKCTFCSYLRRVMAGADTAEAHAPGQQDFLYTLGEEFGIDLQSPESQVSRDRLRRLSMHVTKDPGFAGKKSADAKAYRSPL